MLRSFVLILALSASGAALALPGQCNRYLMECDSGGHGLLLLPVIVLLQLALLYFLVGGPEELLNRLTGRADEGPEPRRESWGGLPIGVPVAIVLSFPPAAVLLLVDYLVWKVGLVEICAVVGAFWWWFLRWLRNLDCQIETTAHAAENPAATPVRATPAIDYRLLPRRAPLKPATAPIESPQPAPVGSPQPAPSLRSAAVPAQPRRADPPYRRPTPAPVVASPEGKLLLTQLTQAFLWEEIGLAEPFLGIRRQTISSIAADIADQNIVAPTVTEVMSLLARRTIDSVLHGRCDLDLSPFRTTLATEDLDEYAIEVMQRLTYSVLFRREQLFVNQLDVDVFGEEFLAVLYRIAIVEAAASGS